MYTSIYLLFLLAHFATSEKLVLVQVLYRHGQRSPAEFYPEDKHKTDWPMGFGQLTNIGKMNEYKLGQFLRQRYIQSNFLSTNYSNKDIYVRSTDVDRTLESAELVLAGMYPPTEYQQWNPSLSWQPIPIHTVPGTQDHILQYDAPKCPEFWAEYKRAHKVDPIKAFNDKYKDLFDYLTKYSGLKVTFDNAWIIRDDTFNELLNNMSVPDWVTKVWPRFENESDKTFGLFVPTLKLKQLKGGPLVNMMVQKMYDNINHNSTVKMYQYSAHDTTTAIWLSALGIFNGKQPPYSTAAMVELYQLDPNKKNPNSEDNYAIKIFYRNNTKTDPYILTVPNCKKMCPLNDFIKLTKDIRIKDVDKECQLPPSPSSSSYTVGTIHILLTSLVMLSYWFD